MIKATSDSGLFHLNRHYSRKENEMYQSMNHRTLTYFREDLSWLFGKDYWDMDNSDYDTTYRYQVNKEAGVGNRRMYSITLAESGLNSMVIPVITMLDFVVTFGKWSQSVKLHGTDAIRSGIISIAEMNIIIANMGKASNGEEFNMAFVFTDGNGNAKNVRVVNLRQGKKNERVYLTADDRLAVKDTLKNFQRLPKKGKKKVILG